ncbi:OB-fold nucleic acid binding domain-containing protein [Rarobacter incanus]|uniref:ATP-dependent DNA helicase RecG n=1 Tax=Rarobacter incanus TaxID=153494 RepID=A0A542SLX6_9MICO|nr:OB-fold nucleic acid binding domain-containing protein [Rarobacter incanus]TQK75568.1 hypothetical protein FB389_0198 [Rarobacter incanus]
MSLATRVRGYFTPREQAADADGLDQFLHGGPVATCKQACGRGRTVIVGRIRSITVQPHSSAPSFEAEVSDGTASIRLVWLGRRTLAGVVPGGIIRARGFVNTAQSIPTIFNPSYELCAKQGHDSGE